MMRLIVLLAFFLPMALSATPVIEGYTAQNSAGVEVDSLELTKPASVAVGDFLLLMVGCDDNGTNSPSVFPQITGWTRFANIGNTTSDAKLGLYWRIADGTETATIWVLQTGAAALNQMFGWYLRLSGTDASTPLNVTGTETNAAGTSHTCAEVTTGVADCLAFYVLAFDGGDGVPFSVSGTGWAQEDEEQSGTGSADACGTFGLKTQASAGLTGDATVTSNVSDGSTTIQFAIAPDGAAPAAVPARRKKVIELLN